MNTILDWLAVASYLVAVVASTLSIYYIHRAIQIMEGKE